MITKNKKVILITYVNIIIVRNIYNDIFKLLCNNLKDLVLNIQPYNVIKYY